MPMLELPSISSVHARGPVDTWYQSHYTPKPTVSSERLPALPQIQSHQSASSNSSSPRGGSISSSSVGGGSIGSNTSYAASVHGQHTGYKTPSPEQTHQSLSRDAQPIQSSPFGTQDGYGFVSNGYNSMNQMQSYADVHQPHMATATHAPASAPPTGLPHYSYPSQQPPMMQPQHQYAQGPPGYPPYGYPGGVPSQIPATSSMNPTMVPSTLQLPAMSSGAPASSLSGAPNYQTQSFDHTGQVAPPGMKPRVTATLWEDEGSLCFQVEAKGVCVARREDNHMINGTKLLNVAGMTRGRRDGILKSEKTRHVVKIGPMHLKGVWIPFERALEFANKEKITEQLYPLFVHDIGALLYHPSNQTRASVGSAAMAVDRNRRPDPMQTRYMTGPPASQPPSLHHHHSMSNPIGAAMSQPPHAIQPHPSSGRPGLDRAHTFPTPPTSASSIMGMGNQGSSYEWSGANVQNTQGGQPLSIDTGLSNTRSVPTTPASTPPGAVQQGMSYGAAQSFDGNRPLYSGPPSQPGQYSQGQPMMGYRQDGAYPKTEMAPPSRITDVPDEGEVKQADGMMPQGNDQVAAPPAGNENEHDHENEYTHSNAPYNGNRGPYGYSTNGPTGAMHPDHAHLSPEMTGSPHQNGSGRGTPRSAATGQQQWNSGYAAPQRQAPSSNLYNVMSDTRGASNGNAPHDTYQAPGAVSQYAPQGYAPNNGVNNSGKRGRDDEDQDPYRPDSVQGDDMSGLKRRKTLEGGAVGGNYADPNPGLQRAHTMAAQRARR
ncbi:KilA-N multi-domain protein [Pyrenophora tritici-repentis]|nr:KilA-N multi-domain protein [Pyrenophora tritici-repentis]